MNCPLQAICKFETDSGAAMEAHILKNHASAICVMSPESEFKGSAIPVWCLRCRNVIEPKGWMDHVFEHRISGLSNKGQDMEQLSLRHCFICYGVFDNANEYSSHSCLEIRQIMKKESEGENVGAFLKCGRCMKYGTTSITKMEDHYRSAHGSGKAASRDFHPSAGTYFCGPCSRYFYGLSAFNCHECNGNPGAVNTGQQKKVLEDVAKALEKIEPKSQKDTPPETKNGEAMTLCTRCGNRFQEWERFADHACHAKSGKKPDVVKIAVFVSPEREETNSMRMAAVEFGKEAIYFVRGTPKEDVLLRSVKEFGGVIVQAGGTNLKERDRAMLVKCDVALFFPSVKDTKYEKITKQYFKVGEIIVPSLLYPDVRTESPALLPSEAEGPKVSER